MHTIRHHPLYRQRERMLTFLGLSYTGGDEYLREFLSSHEKEDSKDFKRRLERAVYPNQIRPIVDTWASHLYREDIKRDGGPDDVMGPMREDIDMMGTSADNFHELTARAAQSIGFAHVLVDRHEPDTDAKIMTRADEMATGRRPYAQRLGERDMVDWDVDKLGRFRWAVIREEEPIEREPLAAEVTTPRYQYRVWYPDRWELYRIAQAPETTDALETVEPDSSQRQALELFETQTHPCGRVPIASVYWGRRFGCEPMAPSAVEDIAPLNRRLTQFYSLIDEQIYQHVFNILCVPEKIWEKLKQVDFSVAGSIPIPDGSVMPSYLGPDAGQVQAIRAEIEHTRVEIRNQSGLGTPEEAAQPHSGVALSYLWRDKNALLRKFAKRMSDHEAEVEELALAWAEKKNQAAKLTRSYPSDFHVSDLTSQLESALQLQAIGVDGEPMGEVVAGIYRSMAGEGIESKRLEELTAQIRARFGEQAKLARQLEQGAVAGLA